MTCEVCGPLDPPSIHDICHAEPDRPNGRRFGCGHPLADHTPGLRCRVCRAECGLDCSPIFRDRRQVRDVPVQGRLL